METQILNLSGIQIAQRCACESYERGPVRGRPCAKLQPLPEPN